jgi:hypothetical protein
MWPRQVIARIEGGLGNQLFQYAAARSLADRLGCDLALDLRGLAENGDRSYQLDLYHTRCSIADAALLNTLPPWRPSRSGRVRSCISQYMPRLYAYPVFWPRDFSYDSRFERIERPVFMVGYWQTEKYFDVDEVRKAFARPREALCQVQLLQRLISTVSLAVQLMRL